MVDGAWVSAKLAEYEERLLARADLFETSVTRSPPIEAAALEIVEGRIGARLPEPLRELYLAELEHYALRWRIRADAWRAAGYDADIHEWGQLVIRKAALLGRDEWFEGLVQITDAGAGNGWFLDLTAPAGVPVVWGDHDAADQLGAVLDSADLLFGDLIGNVVERQSELGELVAVLLRTGRMPKPR